MAETEVKRMEGRGSWPRRVRGRGEKKKRWLSSVPAEKMADRRWTVDLNSIPCTNLAGGAQGEEEGEAEVSVPEEEGAAQAAMEMEE